MQFKINKIVFTDFIIKEVHVQKAFCVTQFEHCSHRASHIHPMRTTHFTVVTTLSTVACAYEMKENMLLHDILSNLHCYHNCPSIFQCVLQQ